MTVSPKAATHTYSFKRPSPGTSIAEAECEGSGGELGWSLKLLRTSRIRLSLYRITVADLDPELTRIALHRAFGTIGMIERLRDGSYGLLLIGPDADDAATTARIVSTLFRVIDDLGRTAEHARVTIAELHRCASEIGDPEDLLVQLVTGAPVVASRNAGPVAA